uniref:transposase n=1 Tax=Paenibacillus plantarum TaxID=2654975 RepID=UPI001FE9A054|nr:transposase [Paenibacillus plantarum]
MTLRSYAAAHPDFRHLCPKAVVMDLDQVYHTWISECFPAAIRISDRFHVHINQDNLSLFVSGYFNGCIEEFVRYFSFINGHHNYVKHIYHPFRASS